MKIDIQGALSAGFSEEDIYKEGLKRGMSFNDIAQQFKPYYESQYNPTDTMSGFEKFMAGAGKAVVDTGRGIGQLFGLVDDEEIKESRARDKALMDTTAGTVGNIAGHLATAVTPGVALKGAGMAKAGQALLAPETMKGAAALGAGLGLIQPAESIQERALNTALGGVLSGVGQGLGKYIGQGIGHPAGKAAQKTEKAAKALGMKTTPGQTTRSTPLLQMESMAESYPATSGLMSKIKDHNQSIVNKVVAKSIGQNADEITEDVIDKALTDIGKKFKEIKDIPHINLGKEAAEELNKIADDYVDVIGGKSNTKVAHLLSDMADKVLDGGMTGEWYKRSRSQLGRELKTAVTTGDANMKEVGIKLTELLDNAVERAVPADKSAMFREARQQWRNWIVASKSLKHPGSSDVTASKLATQLNRMYKDNYLRGNAPTKEVKDLFDITKFANEHRNIVGDSGTSTRSVLQVLAPSAIGGAAGYGMTGDPGTAMMMAAGAPLAARIGLGAYLNPLSKGMIAQRGMEGLGMTGAGPLMRGLGTYLPAALNNQ